MILSAVCFVVHDNLFGYSVALRIEYPRGNIVFPVAIAIITPTYHVLAAGIHCHRGVALISGTFGMYAELCDGFRAVQGEPACEDIVFAVFIDVVLPCN